MAERAEEDVVSLIDDDDDHAVLAEWYRARSAFHEEMRRLLHGLRTNWSRELQFVGGARHERALKKQKVVEA